MTDEKIYDIVIIGGGVNGCGIARDAAGRGLRVLLCEKSDLAQATSSASTKLFHGGLRYLEFFEFNLVRKALKEREVLLRAMPHIAWPMRFVFPYDPALKHPDDLSEFGRILGRFFPFLKGRRPAWLARAGLFLYDHLGGRKILPPTRTLNLEKDPAGQILKPGLKRAFEYSDCCVDDARLVVLNARDAADRGAEIRTRTTCTKARRKDGLWQVTLVSQAIENPENILAKCIVNAAGPWVKEVLESKLAQTSATELKLIRGSHIVVPKITQEERSYFFQLDDGRIIFAIPYQGDFTLIGTTEAEHKDDPSTAACSPQERDYLLRAINRFLNSPLVAEDIVWTFAGVRPLYDDHSGDATSTTRDYLLEVDDDNGNAPALHVFGGKITTYRKLAEDALDRLRPYFPEMPGQWTASEHLPGGDFPVDGLTNLIEEIQSNYPFLTNEWAYRLARSYGTFARQIYGAAGNISDLGPHFGATLYPQEVEWLIETEWALTANDILWRRSKLGLIFTQEQTEKLEEYLSQFRSTDPPRI